MQISRARRVRPPHAVAFGKLLKAARVGAKLTQGQLAIRLGVTSKQVSHYEQGVSEFPVHKMVALIEATKCKFSYFFPEMRTVTESDESIELLSYLGRRVEALPAGVVREQYVSTIREFADNQMDAFVRITEAVK